MLKKIKDCKKEIKKGWKLIEAEPDEIILEDSNIARIEVVANCEGGYDQLVEVIPTDSIIAVLVDERADKIYLHTEKRPAVPRKDCPRIEKGNLYVPFDYLGRDSIETVRGYSEGDWKETTIKEVEEEAGYIVTENDLEKLGEINRGTATNAFYLTVVLVRCNSREEFKDLSKEESKKIINRKWYTVEEVREMIRKNEIFCSLTLAALSLYFHNRK